MLSILICLILVYYYCIDLYTSLNLIDVWVLDVAGRHLVDGLVEDHEHILDALSLLKRSVKLLSEDKIEADVVEELIAFLSRFADQCHHGKEELVLFPLMEKRGVPLWGGPLGVMTCEHGMGRYFLRNALKAVERYKSGDREAINDIMHYTESYYNLLTEHINKENNILFQMAKEVVGEGEGLDEAEKIEEDMNHRELLERLEYLKKAVEASEA